MIEQINIKKSEKIDKDKIPVIKQKKINEFIYFALRNTKLKVGLAVVLFFLLITFIGPLFTDYRWNAYIGPISQPPSAEYWLGTTTFGQDVYTQFVLGLRASFIVGVIGGGIATLIGIIIGFTAGYRGGMVDEGLNILTNIILVIPTFALLLIIAAYLKVRGIMTESIFIGFTAWPWAARAVRAQTFSLRSRDFVDLARLSGVKPLKIIFTEIAPNMMSYLLMTFILQFGGAILIAATLDFIGLGPTNTISLGLMMNYAVLWGALQFGVWWWFVPPGFAIMAIVGSLYIMNVGLDEVFNPKLREM
ncbi:MAG TPA: ABC transporter permease [Candidatus Hydromicrobium sp.]